MSEAASPLGRAGVSQSTTASLPLTEDVRVYSAGGWRSIGIWLQKLERSTMDSFWFPETVLATGTVDAAAAVIESAGLVVSHVIVAGRFTERDAELRARRIDHAVHAVDAARRLHARCLVVVPGSRGTLSARGAFDVAAGALAELLERTEHAGVPLAIEPVQDLGFVETLDAALDLADVIDHPRLGVFPDVFHLWRDPGLEEALIRAGDRILGVHLADGTGIDDDMTRLPPGEGALPLEDFLSWVEATAYSGTYDVELFTMGASAAEAGTVLERCATGMRALLAGVCA
jgi:sugar phosphate isomerase/epimerase